MGGNPHGFEIPIATKFSYVIQYVDKYKRKKSNIENLSSTYIHFLHLRKQQAHAYIE